MRLQTQPVKTRQQLATVPHFVREGSEGTRGDSHHSHCPTTKGNQPNTQTVTLRENLENNPSHPVMKCHRPSQRYLFLMCTTSLNCLNGQNKTATYLWPFTSSSVTETHILLTHSSRLPQIHENISPLQGREETKMRTFNPMKNQSRIPPLDSECLSFGEHRQALYTLCEYSECHSAYSVQCKWQMKEW